MLVSSEYATSCSQSDLAIDTDDQGVARVKRLYHREPV